MDWYKRYIGDYRRDTGGLSLAEHGAYTVLMDEQYATEEGLPSALPELYRLCHATTAGERAAVKKVAKRFFKAGAEGRLFNRRAAREVKRVKNLIDQAVESGKRGAEKRWGNREPDRVPDRLPHQNPNGGSIASQIPDPKNKNSLPSGEVKPGLRHIAELLPSSGNGKHRSPTEEPEEERVRKALVVLAGDPQCTEADAARMFRVSIDAIQAARREP